MMTAKSGVSRSWRSIGKAADEIRVIAKEFLNLGITMDARHDRPRLMYRLRPSPWGWVINDAELYALGHSRQITLPGARLPEPIPPLTLRPAPGLYRGR